jgi:hypothetical protein
MIVFGFVNNYMVVLLILNLGAYPLYHRAELSVCSFIFWLKEVGKRYPFLSFAGCTFGGFCPFLFHLLLMD